MKKELTPEQRELLLEERRILREWFEYQGTKIMLSRLQDMGKSLLAAYDNVNLLDPASKTKVPLASGKTMELTAFEIQVTRRFIGVTLPSILEGIANFEIDPEDDEPWSWANWLKRARTACRERLSLIFKLGRR